MEAPEAAEAGPEPADAAQDDTARAPDGSPLATPPTVALPAVGANYETDAERELQQLLLRIEALAPTLSQTALEMAAGRVARLACSSPAQLAERRRARSQTRLAPPCCRRRRRRGCLTRHPHVPNIPALGRALSGRSGARAAT